MGKNEGEIRKKLNDHLEFVTLKEMNVKAVRRIRKFE